MGGYDGVGNRLSVTASMPGAPASYSGTTSYGYDYGQSANPALSRSQLTGETSTRASGTQSYAYDGGTSGGPGNPTSVRSSTSTFNADNQITGTSRNGSTYSFSYDGNGSPTTYQNAALTFDPENRLLTAPGAGLTLSYTYDGDGHQVTRKAQGHGSPRIFLYKLYDGDTLVSQYYAGSSLSSTSTTGADGLVSVCSVNGSTNTSAFDTFDERGNVSQRLDKTGAVVSSDVYDAYGVRLTTSNAGYQGNFDSYGGQWGYYSDSLLGLVLCTHRYYDPSTGRWLTRDPIGYGGGINLYGYVGNDPGNRWDPSGYLQDPIGDIGTGFGAGVVFGGIVAGIAIIGGVALAPISVPIIVGGIIIGVISGAINEGQHGGGLGEIAEGGLLGGAGGGPGAVFGATCVFRFAPPPPFREPPGETGSGGTGDYGGNTGPQFPLPPEGDPGILPPEGWPTPEGPNPPKM